MIALEEQNFYWDSSEVEKVKQSYKRKLHISEISKTVKRSQIEVACLIMDLGLKGEL
jgi:hypothetical protein